MQSIGSLVRIPVMEVRSKRSYFLQQIIDIYNSEKDKRKKENWKRYISWLKMTKTKHSPQSIKLFKKTRQFIKELNPKSLAFLTSHIPTDDLHYMSSVMRDVSNRGGSGSAWLIGNIK